MCICEHFIYSHDRSAIQKNKRTDLGIHSSQIHECRNWERGRAVSFLGIFISNFHFSVFFCRNQPDLKNRNVKTICSAPVFETLWAKLFPGIFLALKNSNTNKLGVKGWLRGWCISARPHPFLQLTHSEIFNDDIDVYSPPLDISSWREGKKWFG